MSTDAAALFAALCLRLRRLLAALGGLEGSQLGVLAIGAAGIFLSVAVVAWSLS